VGVTDVRRVWPEILAAVKRQRRTTQVLLESATVASVDGSPTGGTLLLTMPSPALARRVMEPGNTDVLRAALHEVLGVGWQIRCEAGDAGAADRSAPAGATEARSDRGWDGPPDARTDSARPSAPATSGSGDRMSGAADDRAPAPPDDDDVDPYDEIDPDGPPAAVQDPEQVAMELLADRLGARRLDPEN
jgi:DNA polymerase-3 subunit gamma/tau